MSFPTCSSVATPPPAACTLSSAQAEEDEDEAATHTFGRADQAFRTEAEEEREDIEAEDEHQHRPSARCLRRQVFPLEHCVIMA